PGRPVPDLVARGVPGPVRGAVADRPRRAGQHARPAAAGADRSRRMNAPAHVSVLLGEVVDALEPAPGKRIVDGTFGAGGYSRAFLEAGAEGIAFDPDPAATVF